MKYMGSKNRHAKELLSIILKDRKPNQWYVEPFVGGANMIDKVNGKRIGSDIHEYLVAMWDAVSKGWMPPMSLTECQYNDIRINKENYPKELVGYVGFACSYSGKWFGGWCRDGKGKRDYVLEAYKNAAKQFPLLKDVLFFHKSYDEFKFKEPVILYCDKPYEGTTKYRDDFEHDKFWEWCRKMTIYGHRVFVSEYNAPNDFKCIWQKTVNNSLTQNTGSKKGVEKLFIYETKN